MAHILKNKTIEVHIALPSEAYKHSRFDWTGKIADVKFRGKYLSGRELADQTEDHFSGRGFYNEFGMDSPLGFNEIEIGDWFHKIGVGLLKKDEAQYNFHKLYEIKPAKFEVSLATDKILIKCQSKSLNGYSYVLKKEISLLESSFEIKYHLENKGEKTIITKEYNHNFISIESKLIGEDYVLKFPFPIKPELFEAHVDPKGIVKIGQKKINFSDTPESPFFFSNISGGESVKAKWELEHTKSKIGISETGDFQTNSINLWGCGHVISPELFIHLNIEPGQSMKWSRTYNVYDLD